MSKEQVRGTKRSAGRTGDGQIRKRLFMPRPATDEAEAEAYALQLLG